MPQCVCCVQASCAELATRRNWVSSKVNSRGDEIVPLTSKGLADDDDVDDDDDPEMKQCCSTVWFDMKILIHS